jgi:hypothetical protein
MKFDHSDAVYGSRHPELFMPTEIYTIFMRGAFSHEDDVAMGFRADAQRKIAEQGLPANLLTVIEIESAEFIRLQKKEELLRDERTQETGDPTMLFDRIKQVEREQCPVRAAALSRIRSHFGGDIFDRFLYSVVAPSIFKEFGTAPDATSLRAAEEGCK